MKYRGVKPLCRAGEQTPFCGQSLHKYLLLSPWEHGSITCLHLLTLRRDCMNCFDQWNVGRSDICHVKIQGIYRYSLLCWPLWWQKSVFQKSLHQLPSLNPMLGDAPQLMHNRHVFWMWNKHLIIESFAVIVTATEPNLYCYTCPNIHSKC